jgi:hypothetical protein
MGEVQLLQLGQNGQLVHVVHAGQAKAQFRDVGNFGYELENRGRVLVQVILEMKAGERGLVVY